jgi:phosphotransferase family enzyme
MKPDAVDRTEQVLGVEAKSWSPVESRGYALGDRWLVEFGDGRTVFAKRAIDQMTADSLRAERRIYDAVVAPFLPRFLGFQDGPLPLLLLEDLSGATWPPPWSGELVDAVLETLVRVAATAPPGGLRRLADDPPGGWDEVERDPVPFLGLRLCSPTWLDAALPALLESSPARLLDGGALLHFDVRSDNLCIRAGQAVLVDWNLACVGNPAFDVALWLPSLALERGPSPTETACERPDVDALGPHVAGFFAARAGLPPPPGAPSVRAFQLAQLEVALPWAVRTLELPRPEAPR